jgi:hypothetical protein
MRHKRTFLFISLIAIVIVLVFFNSCNKISSLLSSGIITLDEQNIVVKIDTPNGRWSAELKGNDVKIDDICFLEGDNPNGWKITATVNRNDTSTLGNFETVTLHGRLLTVDFTTKTNKDVSWNVFFNERNMR